MELGLTDRVAWVAASSAGLGRAVAMELASEGADLVLCARDPERLVQTAAEIRSSTGRRVFAEPADLTRQSEIERLHGRAREELGPVDILVTNVGGPPSGTFEELSQADWDQAVQANLNSVLFLARACLPDMKAKRWGRILNVTSISVKQPVANLMLSNSIRAAVTGFARTLADEVATFGVTVNNLLPGYTRTDRVEQLAESIAQSRGITESEALATWEREIPMGRIGEPREFAALAAFLASERASYITGVSIPVDGGWTRGLF